MKSKIHEYPLKTFFAKRKKLNTAVVIALLLFNYSQVLAQVTKTPLLEEFTSSTCGPCAANNPTFDAMLDNHSGNFVCVKYQMNWPGSGDIYYNSDGNIRRGLYSVLSIPELAVNGNILAGQPATFISSDLSDEQILTTNIIIDAQFTIIDSVLTVFGNIIPQQDISGSLKRYIAVVERHTYNNASSNGENEFSYVEQKMLPNGAGINIGALSSGVSVPFTQTIDLRSVNNIENIDNLMFAVWVQNISTKEVFQSTWATFPTGIQEPIVSASGIVKLYPNPASDQTTIDYQLQENSNVTMKITNAVGQIVFEKLFGKEEFGLHQDYIDTKKLASGIYFIDLQIGSNHYRQPLLVQF